MGTIGTALAIAAASLMFVATSIDPVARPSSSSVLTVEDAANLRLVATAELPGLRPSTFELSAATDGRLVYVVNGATLSAFPVGCGDSGGACAPVWTADAAGARSFESGPIVADDVVLVMTERGVSAFPTSCRVDPCPAAWVGRLPRASVGQLWAVEGVVYVEFGGRVHRGGVSPRSIGVEAFAADCGLGGETCAPLFRSRRYAGTDYHFAPYGGANVAGGLVILERKRDGAIVGFPPGCRLDAQGCPPVWTWIPPSDVRYGSVLGTIGDVIVVDEKAAAANGEGVPPTHIFRIVGIPLSCGGNCDPAWTLDGWGTMADKYLYVGSDPVLVRSWPGSLSVFSTVCVADRGASCRSSWTAAFERVIGDPITISTARGGAAVTSSTQLQIFPPDCVNAGGACEPARVDTGLTDGPWSTIVGDVVFTAGIYSPGGPIRAYPAACSSGSTCPLLWSYRAPGQAFIRGSNPLVVGDRLFVLSDGETGNMLSVFEVAH
jgi:hypothetical protein